MRKMSISKGLILSLVRSCFSSQYGKCGNYANKIISLLLVISTLFVFAFPVSAADGSGEFSIDDCTVISSIIYDDNTVENVSSLMIKEDITSGTFKGLRCFSFPSDVDSETRKQVRIRLIENFSIRADHEYNLKFKWGYNYGMNYTFKVYLRFNDAYGQTIKSQSIYETSYTNNPKPVNTVNSIDLNFTPVIPEEETGYKCDLYMEFVQSEYSLSNRLQSFYISQTLLLTDLDDNTGVLNGIIEAIKEIPEKIKGFFVELGDKIINGIKDLFIPDEEYLQNKKVELETFCVEHFGAVYQSIDVFIDFLNSLVSISPTESKITFPAIDVPVLGKTYHLTDAVNYSFSWVNDSSHFLYYFYNFYRGFVTVILFLGFVNYCRNKYAEVFGGDKE